MQGTASDGGCKIDGGISSFGWAVRKVFVEWDC